MELQREEAIAFISAAGSYLDPILLSYNFYIFPPCCCLCFEISPMKSSLLCPHCSDFAISWKTAQSLELHHLVHKVGLLLLAEVILDLWSPQNVEAQMQSSRRNRGQYILLMLCTLHQVHEGWVFAFWLFSWVENHHCAQHWPRVPEDSVCNTKF